MTSDVWDGDRIPSERAGRHSTCSPANAAIKLRETTPSEGLESEQLGGRRLCALGHRPDSQRDDGSWAVDCKEFTPETPTSAEQPGDVARLQAPRRGRAKARRNGDDGIDRAEAG
ncbi:hypothetical protein CYMTET_15125 [Cymbomonas tetramitiformis]|uniref:Uncharacterized protein n=1 Tax=Cymbomonas tetramitiformis TaxID=36881 RepID=A0AAE0GF65_9CHLO|nr:hypothetical protein CYMTET_15125 [Cymbomonas tetramitiformis]